MPPNTQLPDHFRRSIARSRTLPFCVSSDAMKYRALGRTGWNVSEISFGAWAIGGAWGEGSDDESLAALNRAIDLGVNFIDTADVYGDGRSERLVAQVRKDRPRDTIYVATKAGR